MAKSYRWLKYAATTGCLTTKEYADVIEITTLADMARRHTKEDVRRAWRLESISRKFAALPQSEKDAAIKKLTDMAREALGKK